MKAFAVIGANYGDEGKGLIVDWLCRHVPRPLVIRHNGGAQAGHTVVTPEGKRHVFHHVGSGALAGAPTFLGGEFIVNPMLYCREIVTLTGLCGKLPRIWVDPECRVTTPYDMIANQTRELNRGSDRNGSVGVGIWETVRRSRDPALRIRAGDHPDSIQAKLPRIREYASDRANHSFGDAYDCERIERDFMDALSTFHATTLRIDLRMLISHTNIQTAIFEGAQGLLLDNDAPGAPRHVTPSKTGIHNPKEICRALPYIPPLHAIYVSRTYLTRHGAGPLPDEQPRPEWLVDDTNVDHPYQGTLRYAPLDYGALLARVKADAGGTPLDIALTHCDQIDRILDSFGTDNVGRLESWGPTWKDISVHLDFLEKVLGTL